MIRIIFVACFGFIILQLITVLTVIVSVSKGHEKLNDDLELLRTIVTQYNTLPSDSVGSIPSTYDNFVNDVLRQSETNMYKYDVAIDTGKTYHHRVTNNKALVTPVYTGPYCFKSGTSHSGINEIANPIKIYTSLADTQLSATHDFYSSPNRGQVIYIELTMNVYTPVLSALFRTNDKFSQDYGRHLTQITARTTTIGNAHYKSK